VQHERDIQILYALKQYFGCGVVRTNHGDRMCYRVRNIDHLDNIIVPFFCKHLLKTRKRQDFAVFKSVLKMMKVGDHLNETGLNKIRKLVSKMNRGKLR